MCLPARASPCSPARPSADVLSFSLYGHARAHADLKVVTVGPPGVGKTCIIYRYVHGDFNAASTPVRGAWT